jgi:hypothetical protein
MSLDYSVRISQRARRLQIKINLTGDVEVVVPQGMRSAHVLPFVERHRDWIHKTRSRLLSGQVAPVRDQILPESIEFKVVNGYWEVQYTLDPGCRSSIAESDTLIQVRAADQTVARLTLQRWLSRKARCFLLPHVQQISNVTGLDFQRLTIRAQKSRWGSCSSTGTISLNRALMFLEFDLVRYLIVHELCHTRQMNHSRRYWALVESLEPEFKSYEYRLRKQGHNIPRWAHSLRRD